MRSNRAGTNLIELVVVISVQTVLMATTVGLIGRLLESEQAGRADLQALMALDSLAEQFRHDVNGATQATLLPANAAPSALELQLEAGRLAVYEIHEGRVVRSEKQAAAVLHREAYKLPHSWTVSFRDTIEGQRRMLRMQVSNLLTCDAVLGRDDLLQGAHE